MQYFFIPGRIKNLSLAELKAVANVVLKKEYVLNTQSENYFLLRTEDSAENVDEVFNRLGGFVKYGQLVDDIEGDFLAPYLEFDNVTFGISCYPFKNDYRFASDVISTLSKQLKNALKKNGISARYLTPDENQLTSAQIINRKVLEKGFELSVFQLRDGKTAAGTTLAVQDLGSFVERDYDRPRSDKKMGMLPPKLARMMVNLAQLPKGATIWDPFCGSGTILQEALTLGYNVIGSDISEQAVADTNSNIVWLGKTLGKTNLKYNVFQQDITNVDKKTHHTLRLTDIDAIVCEPYMGPPQRNLLSPSRADRLLDSVAQLYKPLFSLLENINAPNLKVVVILPSYRSYSGWVSMRYNLFLSKRWEILNEKNDPMGLHWSRTNSIIRRNILIAKLKR